MKSESLPTDNILEDEETDEQKELERQIRICRKHDNDIPIPDGYVGIVIRRLKDNLRERVEAVKTNPVLDLHVERSKVLTECLKQCGRDSLIGKYIIKWWSWEVHATRKPRWLTSMDQRRP